VADAWALPLDEFCARLQVVNQIQEQDLLKLKAMMR
jgi:hypothetical protein